MDAQQEAPRAAPLPPKRPLVPLSEFGPIKAFPARGHSQAAMERYKAWFNGEVCRYPVFDENDKHVANKVRGPNKTFYVEGVMPENPKLLGQQAFPPKSAKAITVVEGQDDMIAAYEMMGSRYPVVSVMSASSAQKECRAQFEYLNSFDTIVLCFDNDAPGQEAAKKVADLPFPMGKLKILKLKDHKDANDYKLNNKHEQFTKEWWQAPVYTPDGIKIGKDMWDEVINRPNHFQVNYPFEGLNRLTYGIRLSEFVVVTAETGIGKTSVLKHIEHSLLTNPEIIEKGYGVGFLHLEEPNGDTVLGLLSIHNGKPYHLPDCPRPVDDLRSAFDTVINNDRVVIWDHFGSNTVDAVLDKIRHMHALGCKYIVLDHLSIVVSDQSGDERKQLDEISTKVKTLCMELNMAVIAVIHVNRQGQIRGTAGVEQLANIVMRLERSRTDNDPWRRNVTKITIEKNRFCGRSGPASYLWYNEATGRLTELNQEDIDVYESGGSPGSEGVF